MTYLIVFIFLVYCVWQVDIHGHKKYAKLYYLILFIAFTLIAGLRYKIGGDTINYMSNWNLYPNFESNSIIDDIEKAQLTGGFIRYQPGWILYCMIIKTIFGSYYVCQLITSLILNLGIFHCVRKYSRQPFIVLLYFYVSFNFIQLEFETAREAVATGLFLLFAFDNWIKRKWFLYYIGTLLAFSIHISALVMFILPLLRNTSSWSTKVFIFYGIIPVLVISIAGRIILSDFLIQLANVNSAFQTYEGRVLEDNYNSNYIISALFTPTIINSMVVLWRKYMVNELIPLVFLTAAMIIGTIFDFDCIRFSNYILIPTFISLAPAIQSLIKRQHTVWFGIVLMYLFSLPQYYVVYSGGDLSWSRYFPYQNCIAPNQTPNQKKYWN